MVTVERKVLRNRDKRYAKPLGTIDMKNSYVILFFLMYLLSNNVFSQNQTQGKTKNYLLLQRDDSYYPLAIQENKKIDVHLIDSSLITGKFTVLTDSTIGINGRTILLSEIIQVNGLIKNEVPILISKYIAGLGITAWGVAVIVTEPKKTKIIGAIGAAVGLTITTRAVIRTFYGRKFTKQSGWRFSVGTF